MPPIAQFIDRAALFGMVGAVAALGIGTLAFTDPGDPRAGLQDGTYQRGFETRFEEGLPTRDAAIHGWNALRLGLLGEMSEGAVKGADGWLFTAEEFQPPAERYDLGAEITSARDTLAAFDIQLVAVIVPDKSRILAGHLPIERSGSYQQRYQTILAAVASRNVPAVDLRSALSVRPDAFLRTDTHWSPEGARDAADAIAAALHALDLPPALPATEFQTAALSAAPYDGDLSAFADTGPWRALTGPAPDLLMQYQTHASAAGGSSAGLDLFGEVEVPVALIGSSYSARAEFHFEGHLKTALQADVINYAEVGQGPFKPMRSFLTQLPGLSSLPRLVIWEIPERYVSPEEVIQ